MLEDSSQHLVKRYYKNNKIGSLGLRSIRTHMKTIITNKIFFVNFYVLEELNTTPI